MYKNKNFRALFFVFLFILLSGGVSIGNASALQYTASQCTAIGGAYASNASLCDQLGSGYFSVGEYQNGSCAVTGVCCATTPTPPSGPGCSAATCASIGGTCTSSCGTGYTPSGGGTCSGGQQCCIPGGGGLCESLGGLCVAGTCSSQNRATANGACTTAGDSCCSKQILAACTGSCQSSCGEGLREDSSQICTSGYNKCCVRADGALRPGTLNYTLLEKIPGLPNTNGADLPSYVKAIYRIALIIVTLSAVLMISIGGFMYLTSAGNTSSMGTAKGIIFDSLIGLIIALCAWLVLNVINPDLVNVNITSFAPISLSTPPTGPTPPAGTGTPGTCGGLTPQSGINCADASPQLSSLLACMKLKGITASVSSIGDSKGFAFCKNTWSRPPCAHARTSCHYGGGAAKTAPECSQSLAADISVRNLAGGVDQSIANAVMAAASACGGRVNDETRIPGVAPHIHVSVQSTCCSL